MIAVFELSSLNGRNGFVVNGIDADDFSSGSDASAVDVNGDGFDDLIITGSGANPNGQRLAGETYVVFGKEGGFAASLNLFSLNGVNGFVLRGIDRYDRSGFVASAGDVNGDGFDDQIIGAYGADPAGRSIAGETYVVFGKAGGFAASLDLSSLNGSNGFVLNGIDAYDQSGWSVAAAGDVNGDGIDDLVIGALRADPNGRSAAGETYVVFGRTGGFAASLDLSALNGTNGFVLSGIDADDRSGSSVASAGDVNGDGFDDLIIGAYGADPAGRSFAGESYVVFGQAGGFAASLDLSSLNGSNGFVLNGIDDADFSRSGASAGDVNGDGLDDLIIGAFRADPNGRSAAGESYVVFGQAGGFAASLDLSSLNGSNGFVLNGVDAGDYSGISVASAGDFNGDGVDDLLIGAVGAAPAGRSNAGETYVIFGHTRGFAASLDLSSIDGINGMVLAGIAVNDSSGSSVASAGDVNGDGVDDLIIGAFAADPSGRTDAGQSYVIFGSRGYGNPDVEAGDVLFENAGAGDDAAFVGTRTEAATGTGTFTFDSLDILSGSAFTLGFDEVLDLGGDGTLFVAEGAVFSGNGLIIGNILNAGLIRIPIVPIVLTETLSVVSGGLVEFVRPPTEPGPLVFTSFGGGSAGGGGGGGGGGGSGGVSFGGGTIISVAGPARIETSVVVADEVIRFDADLEVTGDFTQTETGQLRLFIASDTLPGQSYSQLQVGGAVALNGTLQIVFDVEKFPFFGIGGYVPTAGDTFDFVIAEGGLSLDPGLVVETFVTAAGASFFSDDFGLSPFESMNAADPDELFRFDANRFSIALVDETILRATLLDDFGNGAAPVAGDDTFLTDEDTGIGRLAVLGNDQDADDDPLMIIGVDTTGTLGLVTENGDGTFAYDPNGAFENLNTGQSAIDRFTYTISDGRGGTDTATVTITINGVTDIPTITGTAGNDTLAGTDLAELILALGGDDSITGGLGNDTIEGSTGRDLIRAGNGLDLVRGGDGVDTLFGEIGNDTIEGGFGNDQLDGAAGNDRLVGGRANDRLTGGNNNDTFVFSLGDATDTIVDFDARGNDVIELSGFGAAFDTFAEVLGIASVSGTAIRLNFGGGDTLILNKTTLASLTADDFIFA